MKKRVISAITALMLFSTSCVATFSLSVHAISNPSIVVESVEAKPGDDVSVKVSIENNPGVWGMDVRISYDKTDLTLTSVENGGFYQDAEWTKGNLDGDTYVLSYEASSFDNITTSSGVLAILNFKISDSASSQEYAINASYNPGDCINVEFDDINFNIVNGKISLPMSETVHIHTFTKITAKASTCLIHGNNEYYFCEECGKYFKDTEGDTETTIEAETLPIASHNYVENPTAEYLKYEATCIEQAVYNKSCFVCGKKSDETFTYGSTLAHDYSDEWKFNTNGHWRECKACGNKTEEADHVSSGAATEEKAEICAICGYVITPALEHTHKLTLVEGIEATCKSEGQKAYYVCEGCGKWFEDGTASIEITDKKSIVLSKTAHMPSEWIVDKEATETETGSRHKECTFCGEILETEIIPAIVSATTIPVTTVAPTTVTPTMTVPVTTVAPTTVAPTTAAPTTTEPPTMGVSTTNVESTTMVEASSEVKETSSTVETTTQRPVKPVSTVAEPTNNSTSNNSGAIQTGETSLTTLVLIVMMLGVAIIYAVYFKRNKINK